MSAPFNGIIGTLAGLAFGLLRDVHKLPLTDALVLIKWCTRVLDVLQQQPEDGTMHAAIFSIAWSSRRDELLPAATVSGATASTSATAAATDVQLPVPREVVVLPASVVEQIDTSYSTMHHLLGLPTDILAHVLFPFLSLTDIRSSPRCGCRDSSLTPSTLRSLLLLIPRIEGRHHRSASVVVLQEIDCTEAHNIFICIYFCL